MKEKLSVWQNPFITVSLSVSLTAWLYGDWRSGGFFLFIGAVFLFGHFFETD